MGCSQLPTVTLPAHEGVGETTDFDPFDPAPAQRAARSAAAHQRLRARAARDAVVAGPEHGVSRSFPAYYAQAASGPCRAAASLLAHGDAVISCSSRAPGTPRLSSRRRRAPDRERSCFTSRAEGRSHGSRCGNTSRRCRRPSGCLPRASRRRRGPARRTRRPREPPAPQFASLE